MAIRLRGPQFQDCRIGEILVHTSQGVIIFKHQIDYKGPVNESKWGNVLSALGAEYYVVKPDHIIYAVVEKL